MDGASTYDRARQQIVHLIPDNPGGSGPPIEVLTYVGFGPAYRAAGLATFEFASAQVQSAWVTAVDLVAVGGGSGQDANGSAMPGAIAELWTGGTANTWTTVNANSADTAMPAQLHGQVTGALARAAIENGKIRARVISEWPAGPGVASAAVDLIELKVTFESP